MTSGDANKDSTGKGKMVKVYFRLAEFRDSVIRSALMEDDDDDVQVMDTSSPPAPAPAEPLQHSIQQLLRPDATDKPVSNHKIIAPIPIYPANNPFYLANCDPSPTQSSSSLALPPTLPTVPMFPLAGSQPQPVPTLPPLESAELMRLLQEFFKTSNPVQNKKI